MSTSLTRRVRLAYVIPVMSAGLALGYAPSIASAAQGMSTQDRCYIMVCNDDLSICISKEIKCPT